VVDARDAQDTLRLVPARLHVIKDGRVVASTTPSESRIVREGAEETVTFVPKG
jgi:cytosine/creatinine deaminase